MSTLDSHDQSGGGLQRERLVTALILVPGLLLLAWILVRWLGQGSLNERIALPVLGLYAVAASIAGGLMNAQRPAARRAPALMFVMLALFGLALAVQGATALGSTARWTANGLGLASLAVSAILANRRSARS
jgi:hypothetical protein